MTQLPAHLQNRQTKALNETALLGIGSALPPHISIRGNTFTLVDASGAKQAAGPTLDVCIADLSDVMCKQFYPDKWTPDSNDPPLCWSANGVAPSREAMTPQSPTCAACPNNVRGSAVSAISGVAIKACRDERWLALIPAQMPSMRFQLRLTPGSFKNWREYLERCKGSQTDLSNIVTRMTFVPQSNGELAFTAVSYIDEATANARDAGYAEKAFDVLVGRNDVPIQGALPAPTGYAPPTLPPTTAPPTQPAMAPFVPPAANPQPTPFMAQPAAGASPAAFSASAEPQAPASPRRKRRTQAEIAADNAQSTTAAPQAPQQPVPAFAVAPPVAPFRPAATEAGPAPFMQSQPAPAQAPGAQFGIQPGVPPNAEIAATLNNLFAKPAQ